MVGTRLQQERERENERTSGRAAERPSGLRNGQRAAVHTATSRDIHSMDPWMAELVRERGEFE